MENPQNQTRERPADRREPNFTGHPGQTLTVGASPRPEPPPITAEAWAVACALKAEVAWLEKTGKASRIDEAAEVRAAGGEPSAGSTVAMIRRKTSAMLMHCPPPWEPGPVPASLPALWNASMGDGW